MSVVSFVAAQRTEHGVPHALTCRALEVKEAWFYKWLDHEPTPREIRQGDLDIEVKRIFELYDSTYGSPRIHAELVDDGWCVGENTVAASMARQGLQARPKKRWRCLTRPDKRAVPFPDLVKRDFAAEAPNRKWCGDVTEIPTLEGKLYLATALDLFSRRCVGFSIGEHPDAELCCAAIRMALAVRGGDVRGVIFHTDKGSTYTAREHTELCARAGIRQSMGRVGSCFDNAAAESFFSTLEFEVRARRVFKTKKEARLYIATWITDTYNTRRRHYACGMKSPVDFETIAATVADRAA